MERRRLEVQTRLDAAKSAYERNRLGQFATPSALAQAVVAPALAWLPPITPIRFLDPAFGTGSFLSALLALAGPESLAHSRGFEIDRHYGDPAATLWQGCGLTLSQGDFTTAPAPAERATLIICNPPYVRHHHLTPETKARLQALGAERTGIRLSGLAGLYAHFMVLTDAWAAEGAVAAWLVPSEFMAVNYGTEVRRYLCERVTLLRLHRFDPAQVQFGDALVSSAVLWWRHTPPPPNHHVTFSYGGSIATPALTESVPLKTLAGAAKWTRFPAISNTPAESGQAKPVDGLTLGEICTIRRGIATGDNRFFILTKDQITSHDLPPACFRPILPGPRYLPPGETEILAHSDGTPILARPLFLLDCALPEKELRQRHPTLWRYLRRGLEDVAERYLCRHRTPWYAQEQRSPAPLLCTYMGRSRNGGAPFRFIRNRSLATAPNVYLLLYPAPMVIAKPDRLDRLWRGLNRLNSAELIAEGRVYGGGLHKLEPRELARLPLALVPDFADDALSIAAEMMGGTG